MIHCRPVLEGWVLPLPRFTEEETEVPEKLSPGRGLEASRTVLPPTSLSWEAGLPPGVHTAVGSGCAAYVALSFPQVGVAGHQRLPAGREDGSVAALRVPRLLCLFVWQVLSRPLR